MTELKNTFSSLLHCHLNKPVKIRKIQVLSGGCINQAFKIETDERNYFIKLNKAAGAEMFETEAKGLALLKIKSTFTIPEVIGHGVQENFSYLILTFIESGPKSSTYWEDFGKALAMMHQQSQSNFGLDHNNFIGALPQVNTFDKDWISFFINSRINVQVKIAYDSGRIDKKLVDQFHRLSNRLKDLLVIESPSLLHGDLWSGNVLTDQQGKVSLIDPAIYYGNREAELAFTTLFGGFEKEFYRSYGEVSPLSSDYEKRFDIYNLYPLLVHVNLFGGGYVNSVISILKRFL